MTEKTLRAKKMAATRAEYRRVFDNFNLPNRNIVVEHDGQVHVKRAWQSLNRFGWDRWEEV